MQITGADLRRARLHHVSEYYQRAITWARAIIQGLDRPIAGGQAPPLVIDANAAFERFAQVIAESAISASQLGTQGWKVDRNPRKSFLHGLQEQSREPDILVRREIDEVVLAVGDAKYKDILEAVDADWGTAPVSLDAILSGAQPRIGARDWDQLYVYMRLTGANRGFFVVPFWNAEASAIAFETNFRFEKPPVEGDAQVAVLGLNLLHSLKDVRSQAAGRLADWLSRVGRLDERAGHGGH